MSAEFLDSTTVELTTKGHPDVDVLSHFEVIEWVLDEGTDADVQAMVAALLGGEP